MLKHINTIDWLLLALLTVAVKVFLLPDTMLFEVLSIGFVIVFGMGALSSLNMPAEGIEA